MTLVPYPKVYLYRRIVQAKMFIDSHYADKIALDYIADEAYFSKFHFIRLFKHSYGKTPHQYLKHVRVLRARELLKSEATVTEACFGVGFDSVSSFSGLFSKTFGISPLRYVAEQKQLKEHILKQPLAFVPSCYTSQHGWLENSNFEEVPK